jgi:hypothetical protein
MSDEPNNAKMDDLLKAFAKKRREDAGAPIELHPATRRLLQTEVARLAEHTEESTVESDAWTQLFRQFRPLFWLGGVAVVIVVGGIIWMFSRLPEPTHLARNEEESHALAFDKRAAPSSSATEAAGKDLAPVPEARLLRAEKEELVADRSVFGQALPAPLPSTEPLAKSKSLDDLGLADAKTDTDTTLDLNGVAEADFLKKLEQVETPRLALSPAAPAPASVPPAATAPLTGARYESVAAAQVAAPEPAMRQRYNRMAGDEAAAVGGKPQSLANVLNSFSIEQSGDRVLVLDEDGSKYEGRIQVAAEIMRRDTGEARRLPTRSFKSAEASPSSRGSETQRAQTYQFRVVGTNRSLNQPVVFEGNFVAEGAVAGELREKARPAEPDLGRLRIQGRAQVGANEIVIEAVPAAK